ncbi:pre-rRNA processing [Coemansia biformis]|uniref:Pre-rRNA processing n=1 Tax=Coemansia biformis TaxID=1286918 RepID=A0A9W7YBR8_9FUNG|nr:pre-rRNA processing [Coemansia biformis]
MAGAEHALDGLTLPQLRRAASSRFSMLLEGTVDYAAYRQAYRRKLLLEQQPRFDSLDDAEDELRCVLHDEAFARAHSDGAVAAENAALAVDWFASALVGLFSGDEPFENPDFLRLCCMFFASPLYENNARLVQRHLVKRTYAELSVGPGEAYESSLWLLLAFLHLTTEFQPDTFLLCKDSGLFPLLQSLVLADPEKDLHVLAMSLMFEVAQAVELSQTDLACITDALLSFLLDYIERMRYAECDVYNNTATKLVLALNEQLSRQPARPAGPQSPLASDIGDGDGQTLALLAGAAQQSYGRRRRNRGAAGTASVQTMSPPAGNTPQLPSRLPSSYSDHEHARAHHTRASSVGLAADMSLAQDEHDACPPREPRRQPLHALSPSAAALAADTHVLPRSQSMDFRAELRERAPAGPPRPGSDAYSTAPLGSGARGGGVAGEPGDNYTTPLIAILAQRTDCCKTFAENLVFLLNRETDPATLTLILHTLACILANPDTSGILYTNDMHVLTDIVIRDLSNLADAEQRLRRSYLQVVCVLLRNPVYLAARHRLSDIELCLVNMLRQSLVSSQTVLMSARSRSSRRGSASDSSTRHNSTIAELAPGAPLGAAALRLGGGMASPAPSLSSTASEETCCAHASVEEPRSEAPLQKASRRPPPPPPTHPQAGGHEQRGSLLKPQTTPSAGSMAGPPVQPRRRRAPPPPPRSHQSPGSGTCTPILQLSPVAESPQLGGPSPLLTRRKAPPPPSPRSGTRSEQASPLSTARPLPSRRHPPPPLPPPRSRPASRCQQQSSDLPSQLPASSGAAGCPPPAPPPRANSRRHRPEQTGIRRQLSVKKSVSRYKRNSMIQSRRPAPPLPPLRVHGGGGASGSDDSPGNETDGPAPIPAIAERSAEDAESASASAGRPASEHQHMACSDTHTGAVALPSGEDGGEDDDDDGEDLDTPIPTPDAESCAAERRATRTLVTSALRGCHEARILASSNGLVLGPRH